MQKKRQSGAPSLREGESEHEDERDHDDGYGDAHVQHVHAPPRSLPTAFLQLKRPEKQGPSKLNRSGKSLDFPLLLFCSRR